MPSKQINKPSNVANIVYLDATKPNISVNSIKDAQNIACMQ